MTEFYAHDALTSRLAWRDEEIREEAERAGLALPGAADSDEAGPMVAAVRGMVGQWKGRLMGLLQSTTGSPTPPGAATMTSAS